VATPRATTHGPAAEALQDGAEYDAETEDAAEDVDMGNAKASTATAAAAAGVRRVFSEGMRFPVE